MKTTLKLLVCAMLTWMVSGCGEQVIYEYIYHTTYTLKNESSFDIQIDITSKDLPEDSHDSYTINKDSEVIVEFYTGGYTDYPFFVDDENPTKESFVVVSNSQVQVTEYSIDRTGLYNKNSYKLVSSKDNERHYEYTFTDGFFAGGTPIE